MPKPGGADVVIGMNDVDDMLEVNGELGQYTQPGSNLELDMRLLPGHRVGEATALIERLWRV